MALLVSSTMRRAARSSTSSLRQLAPQCAGHTRRYATTVPKLTYFSAWFCPFAHRATLALEHHAGAVPYEWEEALGWEAGKAPSGSENFDASDRDDWYYHWKSPQLLEANPLGMVPTLLEPTSGRVVVESAVCVEFIDEMAAANGTSATPLLPADPYERARARVAAERVTRTVTAGYYQALVRAEESERAAGFAKILDGLRAFTRESRGAFFSGDTLGLVDCILLPYAFRLYVLEHYRGAHFGVPSTGEDGLWDEYQAWLARCVALPQVARTLPDKARYLEHVKKYAEGKARSKVGNAVRRGVEAHQYDDKVDGDEPPAARTAGAR